MRRIVKPSKESVEAILNNDEPVCYPYVNWWLYQKGSDEIIWSSDDQGELHHWCLKNKEVIISELASMVGAKTVNDKYNWLLGENNETTN